MAYTPAAMYDEAMSTICCVYGPPAPCPAFMYNVTVAPGVGWRAKGFYGQNYGFIEGGVRTPMLGRTIIPTETTLEEWAYYVIKAFKQRADPMGGGHLIDHWKLLGAQKAPRISMTPPMMITTWSFPFARQESHTKGDDDGVRGGLP